MAQEEFHALVVRGEKDSARREQLAGYIASRSDHRGSLKDFLRARVDAPASASTQAGNAQPSHDVDRFLKTGLDREQARQIFDASGPNTVLSPQKCPPILCCLLPCLNSTPKMKMYNNNCPESASVTRSSKRFLIDSTNLVVGDVVTVYEGDIVAADMRVVEVLKTPLQADVSVLFTSPSARRAPMTRNLTDKEDSPGVSLLDSGRMLFMGTTMTSGAATCIVTATGKASLWSSMIAMNRWPF